MTAEMLCDAVLAMGAVSMVGLALIVLDCLCDVICGGRKNAERIMSKIWELLFDAHSFAWADEDSTEEVER